MTKMTMPWDFVVKYYPNYSSCDDIAHLLDLEKLLDNSQQDGDDASEMLEEFYEGIGDPQIQIDYNWRLIKAYEAAIEGFIEQQEQNAKELLKDAGYIVGAMWSKDDIIQQADNEEVELTEDQVQQVFDKLSNVDANIGINWDTISMFIHEVIPHVND